MMEPAMTAEEWEFGATNVARILAEQSEYAVMLDSPHDALVAAAELLQCAGPGQQPLFTWEHVDIIRDAASFLRPPGMRYDPDPYEDLADRIAALLPPR